MAADAQGLTGIWIKDQKYFGYYLDPEHEEADCSVFEKTVEWLDIYFEGRDPGFLPPIHMVGTDFQKAVWEILLEIPYGETLSVLFDSQNIDSFWTPLVKNALNHLPVPQTAYDDEGDSLNIRRF